MNETIFNFVPGVLPYGTLNSPVLGNNSQIFDINLTSYVSGAGNDANNFNSDIKISLVYTSGNPYDFTGQDVNSKIIFRTINGRYNNYNNLRHTDWRAAEITHNKFLPLLMIASATVLILISSRSKI